MDKKQIFTLVLIVLVLLYFLNHMASAATMNTIMVPTTSGAPVNRYIYKQPASTSYYISGNYNPYKAQYYN